jgi:hypothetical protein
VLSFAHGGGGGGGSMRLSVSPTVVSDSTNDSLAPVATQQNTGGDSRQRRLTTIPPIILFPDLYHTMQGGRGTPDISRNNGDQSAVAGPVVPMPTNLWSSPIMGSGGGAGGGGCVHGRCTAVRPRALILARSCDLFCPFLAEVSF